MNYCIVQQAETGKVELPERTAYWSSSLRLDEDGVPFSQGPHGEVFRNVSSVAFSIGDRGIEYGLVDGCVPLDMTAKRQAAFAWLEKNAIQVGNALVWNYNYATQVNDLVVAENWPSAFSQAAVATRFLMAGCTTGDGKYLEIARDAARALLLPVSQGGVRSDDDGFVWFQEIPVPDQHAPFIVNAHLYSIFTLLVLDRYFPEENFRKAALAGLNSLERAFDTIDNGYWNRYDLRPRYSGVDFLIEAEGVHVRSLTLVQGETVSSVNFQEQRKRPSANIVWGDLGKAKDGEATAFGRRVFAQFILPEGRSFRPDLLDLPTRFVVEAECCNAVVKLYALGFRPELHEYVELKALERTRSGSTERIVFETGLRDFAWGQVAQEYIPFHADLMALIGRMTSKPDYLVRAVRWQNFHRNWLKDKAQGHPDLALRERRGFHPSAELAEGVASLMGKRLPHEVSEAELRSLIGSLAAAKSGKACEGADTEAARGSQKALLETLALD
ncbi:D-glucuronyl C5-epimerase family protein [Microvirga thermotolerans]|uniref:D-glucuronyl C5-epimerase C-terminal domain-containing protein n=1 Tax=Microvirga thermotolerans TaxID=2651334 RepID=A0A5P9K101_9HYPH|nr:D-glucuronyl C5-epimerase family protein [Microvirga thermotolerans]QFU15904.1 hypothetical protein GDR74_06525 [Microvirga thermotolerans]